MVLVAVKAPPMLLGPARILVLLPVFGWLLLPRLGRLATLDRLVLLARVPLFGHAHNGGINDLSTARDIALRAEMLVEAIEQLFNDAGLGELFAEQPQRRAVRDAVLDAGSQKPRKREAIAHLILDLLVREIVQRLQDQHPKQHDRIGRLPTGRTLALCLRRQYRSLNVAAKALPWHQPVDCLKRIALRRECRQPIIRIEESELPHRASPRIMPSDSRLARVRKIGYFSRCPR